jgi:hypothetical protein
MMQSASCHWASMNTTCNYDLYKRLIFKKKLFSRLHTNAEYQERIADLAPVQQVQVAYSSTSARQRSRSSFDNEMIIDPSVFSNDGIFTVLYYNFLKSYIQLCSNIISIKSDCKRVSYNWFLKDLSNFILFF